MIYLIYCIYAHVHGETNGFLYGMKGADSLPQNEHRRLVIERSFAASLSIPAFLYSLLIHNPWLVAMVIIAELIASALAFSFWHNRSYYLMRDRIDGTMYGARHQSPSSTAKKDFTYEERLKMLIASGVVMMVAGVLIIVFS